MKSAMTSSVIKTWLLPRLVFIPYHATKFVLAVVGTICRAKRKKIYARAPHLALEAGIGGWNLIEYKELYNTACEYLGSANVSRIVIDRNANYLRQVLSLPNKDTVTHYFYDPRTGSQSWIGGFWQSLRIALFLQQNDIVPIAALTDFPMRRWRMQSAMVTARRGVVVSIMSQKEVGHIFPHKRVVGPCLVPFSVKTERVVDSLIAHRADGSPPRAIFAGSLYEPRTTELRIVSEEVRAHGGVFEILGRGIGTERISDEAYWARLCNAEIVFTTASQMTQKGCDLQHLPHLIYRYLEVLACGNLLVAPEVPGIRRYFTPGRDFVAFDTLEHAAEKIHQYLNDASGRLEIARNGKARATALIGARTYWLTVDIGLGADSMT